MPISSQGRIEKVQRLLTAHRRTKAALESEPVVLELHLGTDIAQNWPVITAAYSGLEQTLKYLIAEQRGLTIQELVDFAVVENGEPHGRRTNPYRTHNLGRLFSELDEATKDTVREFYGRYQSLVPYIGIGRVDQFLHRVSGRSGDGYERWRYALIEEKTLPSNSPQALVAIWGVCVQIAQGKDWKYPQVQMPDDELGEELCSPLEVLARRVFSEMHDPDDPFRDIEGEMQAWFRKRCHPLNTFAEALWHFARYEHAGVVDAPAWLSETLTRRAGEVVDQVARAGPTLLRAFVISAQGHTRRGKSVRWNPDRKRFERVRWSLGKRFQDKPPEGEIVIDGRARIGEVPLRSLWVAAEQAGYRVHENRAFAGPPDQFPWYCTLNVTNEREEPMLSIWQQMANDYNDYDDRFHMAVERDPESISEPLVRWIKSARRLSGIRRA